MSHTFPPPGSLLAAERSASSAPCGRSPAHGTGRRRGTALGDHSQSNPLSSRQSPSDWWHCSAEEKNGTNVRQIVICYNIKQKAKSVISHILCMNSATERSALKQGAQPNLEEDWTPPIPSDLASVWNHLMGEENLALTFNAVDSEALPSLSLIILSVNCTNKCTVH